MSALIVGPEILLGLFFARVALAAPRPMMGVRIVNLAAGALLMAEGIGHAFAWLGGAQ